MTEREKELNAFRLARYILCTTDGTCKELCDCVTLLNKKDYKGAKEMLQKRMDFYQSMLDKILKQVNYEETNETEDAQDNVL